MALPNSRESLVEWCLLELGAPVLNINVAEEQIDRCLDDALSYFQDYHFDGVEKLYKMHKITASKATFQAVVTGSFTNGEFVKGLTSGCRALVYSEATNNLSIDFAYVPGQDVPSFTNGEILQGETSGATATLLASNAVVLGDIDNKFLTLDDRIISVIDILPINGGGFANSGGMFDIRYQFALNDMYNLMSTDLVTYDMFRKNLALWNFEFYGVKPFRFNRRTDKCYIDIDWTHQVKPGDFLVIECWGSIDPEQYTKVYAEQFVRKYTCALIKKQWGQNTKKFAGMSLPGNITYNGQTMYDEALREIEVLEKRIQTEFQLPIDFLVG